MVDEFQPSRQKADLAEVVEMLLDKGIVINADIAVSIGDTQLLGVQVRAAIASFETAAKYGLEFPEGTDMRRVAEAAGEPELAEMRDARPVVDPTRGVNVTGESEEGARSLEDESESAGEGESESDGGDDDGLLSDDERGTDHVSARPDPDQPTSGGFDLVSGEGGIGESLTDIGDDSNDDTDGDDSKGETQ
ncbi:gas vesicle protein [Natronolimnobius sp. AArcel1]|uniref:gas vesicle protein GvpJ n=1 Tax=Natronolimnobius sp. AArcel1 TaxID=1679093 RepID=UPI0013EC2FB3|nr:gas vesicle protein [Natronolimnobius sp. AArcel1]NGM69017.1 gas vesicle protein [Natronolimnobius sp. AArcel1]